jgi:hypothetical protein
LRPMTVWWLAGVMWTNGCCSSTPARAIYQH